MINVPAAIGIPSTGDAGALFAHQGGWDEILLVLVPMALVGALLWLAKRRLVRAQRDDDPSATRSIAAPTPRNRPTKSS